MELPPANMSITLQRNFIPALQLYNPDEGDILLLPEIFEEVTTPTSSSTECESKVSTVSPV